VTTSPRLKYILRNSGALRPLPTQVLQRQQKEFKRRFGLSGDLTGMDVNSGFVTANSTSPRLFNIKRNVVP